jgi:hypothetical protein
LNSFSIWASTFACSVDRTAMSRFIMSLQQHPPRVSQRQQRDII